MKNILVSCFSATGTTKVVADKLSSLLDADLFEIKPVKRYTDADLDWTNEKCRTSIEMKENIKPEIANKITNLENYNTICLGFPIWWYKEPTIIDRFLEENDLTEKDIYIFVTSGSSSASGAVDNLKANFPNLNFVDSRRLTGNENDEILKSWVKFNK